MPSKKVLLLDFDDTISPHGSPALEKLDRRITLYMARVLNLSLSLADDLRQSYHQSYGSTLGGLLRHYEVDPHDYFDFIHQVELREFPPPPPGLHQWLTTRNAPVYLFTNARKDWVELGFRAMGLPLQSLWGIFDIEFLSWQGKPHPHAYEKVERWLHRQFSPEVEIHFADDSLANLKPAAGRKWRTIWIHPEAASPPESLSHQALPELCQLEFSG